MNEGNHSGNFEALVLLSVLASLAWHGVRWLMRKRAWQGLGDHQLAPGDRVGWLVQCVDQPTHTRLRLLVPDDVTHFDTDWQIQARICSALKEDIEQAGWIGIDLRDSGLPAHWLGRLVSLKRDRWIVENEACHRRLLEEFGLKAVVVVKQGTVAVMHHVGERGEQSTDHADWTGLVTRSSMFSATCMAVLACEWHVFWLAPAAALMEDQQVSEVLQTPSSELPGFHKSHRMDALSLDDLEPVRTRVLTLIDRAADAVVDVLKRGTKRRPSLS
jgi:hypothetical protein